MNTHHYNKSSSSFLQLTHMQEACSLMLEFQAHINLTSTSDAQVGCNFWPYELSVAYKWHSDAGSKIEVFARRCTGHQALRAIHIDPVEWAIKLTDSCGSVIGAPHVNLLLSTLWNSAEDGGGWELQDQCQAPFTFAQPRTLAAPPDLLKSVHTIACILPCVWAHALLWTTSISVLFDLAQKWQSLVDEVSTFLAADVCLPLPRSPGQDIPFKLNLRFVRCVCACLYVCLCLC